MLTYIISTSLKNIGHSLTVNCRKLDGTFSFYTGNIEDFYVQTLNMLKPIALVNVSKTFGI